MSRASGGVDRRTVDAFQAASAALVGVAARSIAEVDGRVSIVQWRLLVVLHDRGPMASGRAAAALATTPSSLSRLADRLEAAGLVRREPSPTSRRVVHLSLTPEGRAVVDGVLRRRRREIRTILAGVPAADQEAMVAALDRFTAAALAHFGEETPAGL